MNIKKIFYILLGSVLFFIAFYFEKYSDFYQQIKTGLYDFEFYLCLIYCSLASIITNEFIDNGKKVNRRKIIFCSLLVILVLFLK